MDLGKRVRELREKKGYTRYRVTVLTGISGRHIKGIEENTRQPTIETLERLVVPLGITLSELFNEGENVYLSDKERKLIENFRTISEEKADVLLNLSEVLKK